MFLKRLALAGLAIGAGLTTAACNDGYGYGGLDVGYGAPGYGYDGYYDGGYGYGYGGYPSYFGWYGDFYYPGTGIYVYDRYRRPYRWNGDQQRYWQGRRGTYRGSRNGSGNWGGFGGGVRGNPQGYRGNPAVNGVQGYPGRGYGRQNNGDQGYRGDPTGQRGPNYRNFGAQGGSFSGRAAVPNSFNQNRTGGDGTPGYRAQPPGASGATVSPGAGNWRGGGGGNWRGGGGGRGRR